MGEIDNSRAAAFRECPWKYYEAFERNGRGIEPKVIEGEGYSSLQYGARVHELMEELYKGKLIYRRSENEVLETEAEIMMQAYQARYPDEHTKLNIVDCERTFKVALPEFCLDCYSDHTVPYPGDRDMICNECGCRFNRRNHVLVGKMDLVHRVNGVLDIWDHKTEKRGSKSNDIRKWGSRDQASLYLWAAERIYKEPVGNFYVNILTRQSEKGLIGPSFPAERPKIERNRRAIEIAVRDICVVADDIERYKCIFGDGEWPSNRELCYGWGYCPYFQVHRYGEDPALIIEHKFQPREEYLQLEGLKVIQ